MAARVIVQSERAIEQLAEAGVAREKLVRIQHPVFESGVPAAPPSGRTILFFGLIREYKGLDVLLRALADVPDARLVVAGDPLDPVEPLQRLAAGLGVADRVEWRLGFLPDEQIPQLMAEATLVALPYRKIDSSGVLATALGHGRPAVVTDVGGLPDAIRDFGAGRVVPPERRAARSPPRFASCSKRTSWRRPSREPRPLAGRSPGTRPPQPTRRSTARSPREARQGGARPPAGPARARPALAGLRGARALDRARVGPPGDLPPDAAPGESAKPFSMLKFRTMVPNAVELGRELQLSDDPFGLLPNDPRITRSGRFLRRTSLDELPQLWNVLRGQMSLVGPRPDLVEQVANYEPADRRRLDVKPGITGWAQVMGRDEIPWEERFRARRLVRRQLVARARRADRADDLHPARPARAGAGRGHAQHRAGQAERAVREVPPEEWDGLELDAYYRRPYVESAALLDAGRPFLLEHDGAVFAGHRARATRATSSRRTATAARPATASGTRTRVWAARARRREHLRPLPPAARRTSADAPIHVEELAPTVAWRLEPERDLLAGLHFKHRNKVRKAEKRRRDRRAARRPGRVRRRSTRTRCGASTPTASTSSSRPTGTASASCRSSASTRRSTARSSPRRSAWRRRRGCTTT